MKDPLEALAAARAAAAREEPSSPEGEDEDQAPWRLEAPGGSARRLAEWAIIQPDRTEVYSIRRFGMPITWLKRGLIRLLGQYLGQLSAQQSRFNAGIAAHVIRLEERVEALEQAARERDGEPPRA